MKKILSVITSVIASAAFLLSGAGTPEAKAESGCVFPLPAQGSYKTTVLGYYSWGSFHPSYTDQYILGGNGGGMPDSVMDIAAARGTEVYAVADGTVYQNNSHSNGGYNVVIKHDDGSYSYYGHLLYRSALSRGARISKGSLIGYVGMSGSASGYHLHFEWSGHDPYCQFRSMGIDLSIAGNSGASAYPHSHSAPAASENTYIGRIVNTADGLVLHSAANTSDSSAILVMPPNAIVTVYPDRTDRKMLYVDYNGIKGYAWYSYIARVEEAPAENTYIGEVYNTSDGLVLHSAANTSNSSAILIMPPNARVTVYPDKTDRKMLYVDYNGTKGYAWYSYIRRVDSVQNASAASGYNPQAAVDYAARYYSEKHTGYNPAYRNFNSVGGDCANFVSQCLFAGGLPMTSGWYYYGESLSQSSSSWRGVTSMYNYFKKAGYKIIENPTDDQLKAGNPVLYWRSGSSTWGHAMICVGKNSSGTALVAGHNGDCMNVSWKMNGIYKTCTILIC